MEKIINHGGLEVSTSHKPTDMPSGKPLLNKDGYILVRKCVWNYMAALGILSYLQGSTQQEISMAVHQCARFCNNLLLVHKHAFIRITKYLSSTSTYVDLIDVNWRLTTHGVFYKPKIKIIECYVDNDFSRKFYVAYRICHNIRRMYSIMVQ